MRGVRVDGKDAALTPDVYDEPVLDVLRQDDALQGSTIPVVRRLPAEH